MADGDLRVSGFKRWDDVTRNPDGTVNEVTRIRLWLGTHGPFEQTFPRLVDVYVVEAWIRTKREELARLAAL